MKEKCGDGFISLHYPTGISFLKRAPNVVLLISSLSVAQESWLATV